MQDKSTIFHEEVKKEKIYYSYVHHFSDFENIINVPNLSCTYLKIIIGYLQLKLSTNLV